MRTTVTLDDDVAAALEHLQAERGQRLSQVLNAVVRAGLQQPAERRPFRQRTASLGVKIDVRNVAEALEQLDGPAYR